MDRRKGLTVRSDSGIGIEFMYRGQRCRETLKIPATKPNLLYAERMRHAILLEIAQGTFNYAKHFPGSKKAKSLSRTSLQTVGHALDAYLIGARARCAPSTLKGYESAVNHHLRPVFGDKLLSEVTAADIKAWTGFAGVSAKRINNLLIPLRGIFGDAFSDGLIERDPATRVKNLRVQTREPDPLAPDEVDLLLGACDGQIRNLFQFAIWTGLRTGELIALEWADVDRVKGVIRVQRSVVLKHVKAPKTAAGVRDVRILPGAGTALDAQKKHTLSYAKQIFFNPRTNAPWETDGQIRKTAWQPTIKRAGIRPRNPYQTFSPCG